MEFRWYIGKTVDGTSTLIDLTPGNWVDLSGGNWILNPGSFIHNVFGISASCVETLADIFTVGQEYLVSYDSIDNSGGAISAFIRPYAGDHSAQLYESNQDLTFGTKTHFPHFVRAGKRMRFVANNLVEIQNLIVYPYNWNAALENEDCPVIEDEVTLSISRSERVLASTINSISGVKFYGTSYTYLVNSINTYGNVIPVKIECRQSRFDAWVTYFVGNIYARDITWDLERQTCICDIEDSGAGNLIIKNIDKEVNIPNTFGWTYNSIQTDYYADVFDLVSLHDPITAAYGSVYPHARINKLLDAVLLEATGLRVGLNTTTLQDQPSYNNTGTADMFAGVGSPKGSGYTTLVRSYNIMITTTLREVIEQYFRYFSTFCFCVTDGNEVPIMACDNSNILRVASGLTFTDVAEIKMLPFDQNKKVNTVGFTKIDVNDVSGTIDFKSIVDDYEGIDENSSNWLGGNCNSQTTTALDNAVWFAYTNALSGTPTKFDNDKWILEYETSIVPFYVSIIGVNNIYNSNFQPDIWLARHADILDADFIANSDARFNIYLLTNTFIVTARNTFLKIVEFDYPITFADIQTIIGNPYATIAITSNCIDPYTGLAINTNFQPLEIKYFPNKSMASFRGYME